MTAPDLINLSALIDDARCFALVRQHRWPEGMRCPACGDGGVVRDGFDDTQPQRQPAAIATSVARRPSVCERSPSPITRFQRPISASTKARQL
jgi:Transposase zinc-ribbon domain